ncbi:hypothetical protein I309_02705 [Cryptococcus deuterogattii LA55]|nr:hypothetical protein I309_02705 [Cryptococcus deuterogattii LA55]KIR34978.1 hypothetical protein I352_02236 [Cryptococcus deuterogattii MMRL2647]KIR93886.1 hypothetical protein I304_02571 [Cryptococcus deuterogattii CBS 10090]KIS00154.1 hypothetical protein L804_02800 [Cryptococcus deuterogattii 2001/935-1]
MSKVVPLCAIPGGNQPVSLLIMPFLFLLPFGRPGLTSIENGSSISWYGML